LRPRGLLALFGQSSGPVEPFNPAILNAKGSLFLTRPSLFHYVAERAELLERARDVFDSLLAGDLKIRIDRAYPLAEVADAHRHIEGRGTTGKIVLAP
jgi:NADPH2:quinone reductase